LNEGEDVMRVGTLSLERWSCEHATFSAQ